jgi:hypothetical protein
VQTAHILTECGMTAQLEKTIQLARGTASVDVHSRDSGGTPPMLYLCECKNWATRVSKEKVHAFRTVVADAGANCGFLISGKENGTGPILINWVVIGSGGENYGRSAT